MQGTDTRGNKTTGKKVAIDILMEVPVGKFVKYAKVSKNLYCGWGKANDARKFIKNISSVVKKDSKS